MSDFQTIAKGAETIRSAAADGHGQLRDGGDVADALESAEDIVNDCKTLLKQAQQLRDRLYVQCPAAARGEA